MKKLLVLAGFLLVGFGGTRLISTGERQPHILVFSKTAAFYHQSIPLGEKVLLHMAKEKGFEADTTKDAEFFSDERLRTYDAVVFLNTTGDVLDSDQQAAFERYIRNGGGYMGIHAASDTEYEWEWYGQLVGAYFVSHPAIQEARLNVVDHDHPATKGLPDVWTRTDEWYNLRYVNDQVHVLLALDEASYLLGDGNPGNADHPHAWSHEFDGGRSFYTAMGHTEASYSEQLFLDHLWGGLQYAIGYSDSPEIQ